MQFEASNIYHIYNRGNNKQQIFFSRDNYLYFLNKVHKYIYPCCDILAWCLMTNHFHFLIHANEETVTIIKKTPIKINRLTEGFRLLLSSYAQGINKQQKSTGNLFQQKTKFKNVSSGDGNGGLTAFNYVHRNPFAAGLVKNLEDWEFSSFVDYAGLRNGKLCNINLAKQLFEITQRDIFISNSYKEIPEEFIQKIL